MKILFATDGDKQSAAAIEMMRKFNIDANDEIRIISVIDMAVPMSVDIYGGYVPDTVELEKAAKENAVRILSETEAKLRENYPDVQLNITTDVKFGTPESRIADIAEEMHPELVIIGSHGYRAWERLLLGSVSDSVLHHVPCSVLIVKTPKQ